MARDSDPDSPTIGVAETARILGYNKKTMYAAIKEGRFPAIEIRGRYRIARSVVRSILEQGRVAPSGGKNGGTTR